MEVIIMVGTPGSGKSTYTSRRYPAPIVCSADHFFEREGEYKFDPSKLPEAHAACLRKFASHVALQAFSTIIVDNTNTTEVEIAPYYALAKAYGYNVKIVRMKCAPEVAHARNVHGVPLPAIKAMMDRIGRMRLPLFWDVEHEEVITGLQ